MRSQWWGLIWQDWWLFKKWKSYQRCRSAEERPFEDPARKWVSAGQEERVSPKSRLLAPSRGISSLQNYEKSTFGCLSHSVHNILLQQPKLTRTWLPRLGQCHSTSSWFCTPFLECIHWILKLKCMTSGYPEAAMLERPVDRIHENRGVPEEHQLF